MKINKDRIRKKLVKFNLTSIFFFILSLVSTTFAWFAFSNVVNNNLEIEVKAWDVNITEGENNVSNEIGIKVESFHPGSETTTKTININNNGDLDSKVTYTVTHARILNNVLDTTNQVELLDKLSQEYPFTINFALGTQYLNAQNSTTFMYSIDWPLDSGDDVFDTQWGINASEFIKEENEKKQKDNDYVIRSSIELKVTLNVTQNIKEEDPNTLDNNYMTGNEFLFDSSSNPCDTVSSSCFKYYVIDTNNKITDEEYNLLLDPTGNISMGSVNDITPNRVITLEELLDIIKIDVIDTKIVTQGISNKILGNISVSKYETLKNALKLNNSEIHFSRNTFNYLKSDTCYWTSTKVDDTHTYAVKNLDTNTIKIYPELNTNSCKIVSVIKKAK